MRRLLHNLRGLCLENIVSCAEKIYRPTSRQLLIMLMFSMRVEVDRLKDADSRRS